MGRVRSCQGRANVNSAKDARRNAGGDPILRPLGRRLHSEDSGEYMAILLRSPVFATRPARALTAVGATRRPFRLARGPKWISVWETTKLGSAAVFCMALPAPAAVGAQNPISSSPKRANRQGGRTPHARAAKGKPGARGWVARFRRSASHCQSSNEKRLPCRLNWLNFAFWAKSGSSDRHVAYYGDRAGSKVFHHARGRRGRPRGSFRDQGRCKTIAPAWPSHASRVHVTLLHTPARIDPKINRRT